MILFYRTPKDKKSSFSYNGKVLSLFRIFPYKIDSEFDRVKKIGIRHLDWNIEV